MQNLFDIAIHLNLLSGTDGLNTEKNKSEIQQYSPMSEQKQEQIQL